MIGVEKDMKRLLLLLLILASCGEPKRPRFRDIAGLYTSEKGDSLLLKIDSPYGKFRYTNADSTSEGTWHVIVPDSAGRFGCYQYNEGESSFFLSGYPGFYVAIGRKSGHMTFKDYKGVVYTRQ